MVILDLDQGVERIVLRDPVILRLQRKGKDPGTFVLYRQIHGLLEDLAVRRQCDFLGLQEDIVFPDRQRRLPAGETVAPIRDVDDSC